MGKAAMTPLHVRESGEGNSPALLFIHGGGVSSRMWQRELATYTEFYCLAPDLPGHGESARLRPFTLASAVDGVAEVIRARSPTGRASIIAFSVGAVVALALATRHPQHVARLFISGPTPRLGPVAVRTFDVLARPLLSLLSRNLRMRLIGASLGLSAAQMEVFRADLDHLNLALIGEINRVVASQELAPSCDAPTLMVVGAREIRASRLRAQELTRGLPHAQGFMVRDAGHAWNLEAPDLFDQVVRAWMSDAPLPARLEPFAP